MSKLVRFLSRRRTGKGIKRGVQEPDPKKSKHVIVCTVILLDGTDVTIELPKGSLGDVLYQRVFYHLDLLETSYFGLQYTDSSNVNHWLDTTKKIKKQVLIGPPYTLKLKVKFYPTEPSTLKEELTRYQFFLQCKKDVLSGALPCPEEAMAIELAALALQSELGDYDEDDHTPAFISEFRFMPEQSEDMEMEIYQKYQSLRAQRMTPDKAELNYLHKVKWLDLYGVDMHFVMGRDGLRYKLGLTPTGVLVFEGEEKIGLFYWPKITKFNFKKRKLILVVMEDNEGAEQTEAKQEHTFVFRLENPKACKHLWKCAIEHHTFFRVVVQPTQERSRQGFIRLGSRFRYSGRTQFEQLNKSQARRSVKFERQPSKRFSRRASLEARERTRRRIPPASLIAKQKAAAAAGNVAVSAAVQSPVGDIPSPVSPTASTSITTPIGANITGSVTNGTLERGASSPMDRLDNLIINGERNGTASRNSSTRTPSSRERTPPANNSTSVSLMDQSELAQAKIKGLSHNNGTPEPPPRPTKDVNLYQNNQVKVFGTKEKVPIEIKSNILKARADEERHSAGGAAVMQEDDDVSTESEDESPASPLGHQKEHHFNGSRLPRNASTSSNKSSPSPVSNKPYPNFSRDRENKSPIKQALASSNSPPRRGVSKTTMPSSSDDMTPLLGSVVTGGGGVSPVHSNSSSPLTSPQMLSLLPDIADSSLISAAAAAEETSVDGSRSSKRSASGRMDSSLKVNGDINVPTVSSRTLPTPAPRKYEKRVCVTTEL